jgi:predicted HAD superfamily hydrolase
MMGFTTALSREPVNMSEEVEDARSIHLGQSCHKQNEIDKRLGINTRMVRYDLHEKEKSTVPRRRVGKLDPFMSTFISILEKDSFYNIVAIHARLKSARFEGGISMNRPGFARDPFM